MKRILIVSLGISALAFSTPSFSQDPIVDHIEHIGFGVKVDSGLVTNKEATRRAIWSDTIHVKNAPWMRLRFDDVSLGETPKGGMPTTLRITSLFDGAEQELNAEHLKQWFNTSAYFNGDSVRIEIMADSGAATSRLQMTEVWVGTGDVDQGGIATICGPVDTRQLSYEKANARLLGPANATICTSWMIDDGNYCFLTAGHCAADAGSTVQFNVPLSSPSGSIQHPPPRDQYSVDPSSALGFATVVTVGDDWGYFGVLPNSATNMTAFETQGEAYSIARFAPTPSGNNIRITGYGATSFPVSPTFYAVQKTHTGPHISTIGTAVRYGAHSTGGNSGGPIFDLDSGLAIGIHTHGGCTSSGGGSNSGTAIHHLALQQALNNPRGTCIPLPPDNDLCINALPVFDGTTDFSIYGALMDGPLEPNDCSAGSSTVDHDIWYTYQATCTGEATVSLCGTRFDTKLAVYIACPAAPGESIACNDDACGTASEVTFAVDEGENYFIRLGSTDGTVGRGTINITCVGPDPCPFDIFPPAGDGFIDVDDLLLVINLWGTCPAKGECDADIAPKGGDGHVNVDDLIVIINNWGPCP